MPKTAAVVAGAYALAMPPRPAPRALVGATVRADATGDVKELIGTLAKSFEAFKAENDKKLSDVVHSEKVERINADITKLQAAVDEQSKVADAAQKALDELNAKLAAGQMRPGESTGDLPATPPEYVAAFKAFMRRGDEDAVRAAAVKAAMDKGSDANGGFLAPIEWDRTIIGRLKQISPIRENARVISITGAGFKKLFTDRAVGSGWVGETAPRPATSTPQVGALDFVTGELYANPAISQQLLDDSAIDLQAWLAGEVEYEFARQEGIAFLSGNGTNKPFGILTYVDGAANAARHPWGAIQVTKTGAAAALTGDGFIDLMYSLPGEFAGNAKLYINRMSVGATRKLKDGQGNYLWQPSYQQGQPQTLNGAPIVELPDMPTVAAGNIAALYGDMAATYLVIDRIGISVLRDPFTNKPYVHFYTVKRVGGGVVNPEPMRALQVGVAA
nr:phage major capsid protein [Methylobacterium platani]